MKIISWAAVLFVFLVLSQQSNGQISDGSKTQSDAERQLREQEREALKQAVSASKINELLEDAKLTTDELTKLSKATDAFLARSNALLTNDDGKKIAMDKTAFLTFVDVQQNPDVSKETIDAKLSTVSAITDALTKAQADSKVGLIPPASVVDELAEAKQWAKTTLTKVQTTDSILNAAIDKASKDKALIGLPTLRGSIDAYRLAQMSFLAAQTKGEEAAKPEAEQKMAESGRIAELLRAQEESDKLLRQTRAELERMRINNEMEIAKLKDEQAERESALEKKLADAQAARTIAAAQNQVTVEKATQDAEFAKKRQKCHDPDVTATLAPFLASAYFQPKTGRGIDSKPMSLSEMRAVEALTPGAHGLNQLIECADWPQSDRPGWGKFRNVNQATNEQLEMVKKAQGYLNDLGDALVAEKLLSP